MECAGAHGLAPQGNWALEGPVGNRFVVREINKLRTEVRLQVIDSSSKISRCRK